MSLWKIAWRNVTQRSLSSTLTSLSMALGVALVVAVLVIHGVVSESFRQSAQGYDMIVGPKGGRLELVLNTLFHLGRPTGTIPWSVYKDFTSGRFASDAAVAIPCCLGDNFQGYRVVGTIPKLFDVEYVQGKPYRFADGRNFETDHFYEAVIGSVVATKTGLKVGDSFEPTHGVTTEEEHGHKHDPFTVVGILAPTGTPNDRALFVNIEGFFLLDGHAKPAPAGTEHSHHDHGDEHDGHHHEDEHADHPHEHGEHAEHPDEEHAEDHHDHADDHGSHEHEGEHAEHADHHEEHDDHDAEANPDEHAEHDDPHESEPGQHAEEHPEQDAHAEEHHEHEGEDAAHEHESEHTADAPKQARPRVIGFLVEDDDADHHEHGDQPHDHAAEDHHHDHGAAHHDHDGHHHDHDGHHHHHGPLPENQRELTAILVRSSNPIAALHLPRLINSEPNAQAVLPIGEVNRLFDGIVGSVQLLLMVLTILVVVVAAIGVMVSIYNTMSARRREIAVMRALGARRGTVMSIVLLESTLLSLVGGLAGLALGHAVIGILSPWIVNQTGVPLGFLQFELNELILIPVLVLLTSLSGFLPAVTAYNTDVARSLGATP